VPVLVFVVVAAVRSGYWATLEASPLSDWNLWMETDEWGFVDWSAHLASGNWLDIPAWRSYFFWQTPYGPPEAWERWYQKNAYFAGPLYPYGLALIRIGGLPLLPTVRLLQLLLACVAAAILAAAAQAVAGRFLLERKEGSGEAAGLSASFPGPALAGLVAGLLYGLYGPLVFHDGFAYRDGPVAHVSALLLAWPLLGRVGKSDRERESSNGGAEAFFLGLLGGLAMLLKQTTAPLAVASVYCLSRRSPVGAQRRVALFGTLGLALPLAALAARNLAAGVPPLTFDTRQAASVAWANGRGADGTTSPPPTLKGILEEAGGSTSRTAWLVLRGYADAPWELPRLLTKKAVTFFLSYEVPDNSNWYFFRDHLPVLRLLPVFPCLVGFGTLGLLVAARCGPFPPGGGALALVAFAVPLAACVLAVTTSRYRASVAPPLALGCGLFVLWLARTWRAGDRGAAIALCSTGVLAGILSAAVPSPIPAPRHRWSDTIVAATLTEAREGPAAAALEIDRYRSSGKDDPRYERGLKALSAWQAGDRTAARVAPAGVAPPEARYRDGRSVNDHPDAGQPTGKDRSR